VVQGTARQAVKKVAFVGIRSTSKDDTGRCQSLKGTSADDGGATAAKPYTTGVF